jgi:hypothetical protein
VHLKFLYIRRTDDNPLVSIFVPRGTAITSAIIFGNESTET